MQPATSVSPPASPPLTHSQWVCRICFKDPLDLVGGPSYLDALAADYCIQLDFKTSPFQTIFFFLQYISRNTKHVRVQLGTAYINAYFQDSGLPACFAVRTPNFAVATCLI